MNIHTLNPRGIILAGRSDTRLDPVADSAVSARSTTTSRVSRGLPGMILSGTLSAPSCLPKIRPTLRSVSITLIFYLNAPDA